MNTLNELGKRFIVLFVITLTALSLCMLINWCWRKLVAWFPYQSGVELLDRLQSHPIIFMVVVCAVMAFIGALLSRRDD
jgi:hypothetical protein